MSRVTSLSVRDTRPYLSVEPSAQSFTINLMNLKLSGSGAKVYTSSEESTWRKNGDVQEIFE